MTSRQFGDSLVVRADCRDVEFPRAILADGSDADRRNLQTNESLGDTRVVQIGDHAVELPVVKIGDFCLWVIFNEHAPLARLANEPRHPFDHLAIEAFVQAHHQSNMFHVGTPLIVLCPAARDVGLDKAELRSPHWRPGCKVD